MEEAAGYNVDAPIVVAVIHSSTDTVVRRETEIIKCVICDCELTSSAAFEVHKNGLRHRKKLQALQILEELKWANDTELHFRQDRRNPQDLRCQLCGIAVNSPQQLESHFGGSKHLKKLIQAGLHNV